MADVVPLLDRIKGRFSEPSIQESMKGFTKKVMFDFTDTKEQYVLSVVDGKEASVEKSPAQNADVVVTISTDTLAGIMNRTANPVTAYITRKIKVKGSMDDLMKLQKIML
jgi:putative sterol carrier protein